MRATRRTARATENFTMQDIPIRIYRPDDLASIKQLTVESFARVTLEQNVEQALGLLHGHDWHWRKARHIDQDVAANPDGVFVAESEGHIVGYITTLVDREGGKGRIPNLAVAAEFRGHGLGRRLIEHALDYFRREGLAYAVIETMAQNEAGQGLYPSCGFVEVARQIHFARKL
jgi:ribosomal protein S18 acetylase RimI-like enzyme